MALSTAYTVSCTVTESSATVGAMSKAESALSTYTEITAHRMSIATGVADQAVNLGGCSSGDLVFIKTDQAVSIKINGDDLAIPIRSVCVLSAGITAMTISNSSGQTATVDIIILD